MLARQSATSRSRILVGGVLATRCYATKQPKTTVKAAPKTSKTKAATEKGTAIKTTIVKATTAKVTAAKATSGGKKTGVISSGKSSTPLPKTNTGVPLPPLSTPLTSTLPDSASRTNSASTEPLASAIEDASNTAAAREEQLRVARLRRLERERDDDKGEKAAGEYKVRYKKAARRYTAVMIAMPILLVTSYYLFQQCECFLVWLSSFAASYECVMRTDSGQWCWGTRRRCLNWAICVNSANSVNTGVRRGHEDGLTLRSLYNTTISSVAVNRQTVALDERQLEKPSDCTQCTPYSHTGRTLLVVGLLDPVTLTSALRSILQ